MTQDTEARPGGGATEKTQQVASQAQEKTQQVASQAQEKTQEVASQAQERLRTQVDQRSTQAGQRVHETANDLRSVSQHLREQGREGPARMVEQAAQRAQRLGGYLEESDADRILSDVEDMVRRRPWVVVAGGMTLGIMASRFLKASSSQRYTTRSGSGDGASSARDTGTTARGELTGAV
jgi:ElaB/YqjD/DUF883 family membrane-anchored ribosome-binding protein